MITKTRSFRLKEDELKKLSEIGFGNATTGIKLLLSLYLKKEQQSKNDEGDEK